MSYLTDADALAIPPDLLPGPPVTIAKASQTHWPKADMIVGGYLYHYSRLHDEFIRYDVLEWINDRRKANQTNEATE
jgi:hypothetical protein